MSKKKSIESIESFESIKSGESFEKRNVDCQPASEKSVKSVESRVSEQASFWRSLGKFERIFVVGLVALLSLSVFGFVGSKISSSFSISGSATSENLGTSSPNTLTPNALNPVTTTATPVLSKEYVYAGSRMLAVQDANANAAPPADLAVWRPSTGTWYVLGGVPGSTQVSFPWGASTDKTAPGDYDGDGKTDFSIFRPSNGNWWIFKSSDNTYYSAQFGAGTDTIAQADYDGDGKTDAAVFRPSNGTWYIQPSGGSGFYGVTFGLASDIPAQADYDGDGKADIGVWRESNKTFYSLNSSNSTTSAATIIPTDITNPEPTNTPISGDYDGDGRADYALRNGAYWVIRKSSNGSLQPSIVWQTAGDIAVQNDYDGDGKVDIAVWNNTNGNWFIQQSGSNNSLRQVAWGTTGDIPVPAYYRR